MKLAESVVIITGGAKRIGACIARDLASCGARIVVHCHTSAVEAEETVHAIEEHGGNAISVVCDLRETALLGRVTDAALNAFGRIDAVVNCASVFKPIPLKEVTIESWNEDVAIHQSAPFFLSRLLYEEVTHEEGRLWPACVVNITDADLFHPSADRPSYYCAKSALDAQTRVLAVLLAPAVRVNAVAPGAVLSSSVAEERYFEKSARQVPLKHLATPDEVAEAVRFLLENDSLTAQTIVVDSGKHLR